MRRLFPIAFMTIVSRSRGIPLLILRGGGGSEVATALSNRPRSSVSKTGRRVSSS